MDKNNGYVSREFCSKNIFRGGPTDEDYDHNQSNIAREGYDSSGT